MLNFQVVKLSVLPMVSNGPRCQIVHFYPWCQIVRSVKLSTASNCPRRKIDHGVKLSAVSNYPVSNCPKCQIVRGVKLSYNLNNYIQFDVWYKSKWRKVDLIDSLRAGCVRPNYQLPLFHRPQDASLLFHAAYLAPCTLHPAPCALQNQTDVITTRWALPQGFLVHRNGSKVKMHLAHIVKPHHKKERCK